MTDLSQLKNEIDEIKKRNERVELDKAWEMSIARKLLIAVLTYVTIVIFLIFTHLPNPFISAIVPTIGFVLSTVSVSIFKKVWIARRKH